MSFSSDKITSLNQSVPGRNPPVGREPPWFKKNPFFAKGRLVPEIPLLRGKLVTSREAEDWAKKKIYFVRKRKIFKLKPEERIQIIKEITDNSKNITYENLLSGLRRLEEKKARLRGKTFKEKQELKNKIDMAKLALGKKLPRRFEKL